ncbi:MAG: hypothetical protein EP319_08245 [Deltaproteobacteria bacterium]|nr:MAG: hypothetical protein EP319_08245 [Deltaproteobacteria bacterium]
MVGLILLIVILVFIPADWLLKLSSRIYMRRNSQVSSVYQAEKLLFDLKMGKIQDQTPVQFKFYGELIQNLINLYKRNGELNLSSLDQLQTNLNSDYKFEKKRREINLSSKLQFLLTALFIWVFVLAVRYMVGEELPIWSYFIIGLLQVTGSLFFVFGNLLITKRVFGNSDDYLKSFVWFRNLYLSNLDMGQVIRESRILEIEAQKLPNEFSDLYTRVKMLIYEWKMSGENIHRELELYDSRMGYLREEQFEKLLKNVKLVQFLTLCLFFLPSYFVLILSLFSSFLIE